MNSQKSGCLLRLTRCARISLTFTIFLFGAFLAPASRASTDFDVNIELGAIHSDNIFLDTEGQEQSETVYTITPRFYLTSDDPRFKSEIRYEPQAIFYSDFDDANEIFHIVDASLTSALVRDRLFLELSATNFQTIKEPEARIPSGNLSLSGNRLGARVLQASPYWQQRIGRANLLIRGSYSDHDYDDDSFQSSNSREGYFELGNIERQEGFAWQLDYVYRRTEYANSLPWEFQRAALNLGIWVNEGMRLFIVAGAETAFDNLFEANLDSDFWEAGIQYSPNRRLNLEIAAGDRSYGTSLRGELSYELKRGQLSASYTEGPSSRGDLLADRNPLRPSEDLDGALDRPGESDRFVRKRGDLSVSVELTKSDLTLRFFAESREERLAPDGSALEDEQLTGLIARWSWNLGRKTTLGLNGYLANREYSGVDDEFRRAHVDIEYQQSATLGLRAEIARFSQRGETSSNRDYTENQFRFFVNLGFE